MPGLCRDCLAFGEDVAAPCARCGSGACVRHGELDALAIAHVDCDAFYASVEKRDDPSLRDKPLIIGHTGGRGVVTTACYIARQFGPRSAMPMFKALKLCPDAIVRPPDMAKYQAVSGEIREILATATGRIEPVSIDEAYLDLSAPDRVRDEPAAVALARVARDIARDIGVTVSIGLSYNKFLAKLASDIEKPHGFSVIGRAEARGFLSALPVTKIHGVGKATAERMARAGWQTIGQLQEVAEEELVARFGRFGRRLAEFVQGEDPRKVSTSRETKSISVETTFASDIAEAAGLEAALAPLCERLAGRLRAKGMAGRCVVLKLKTADFKTLTRQHRLSTPTQRHGMVLDAARLLLARETDGRAFRLIGVGVSDLCAADDADPPDLFDVAAGKG